MEYWRIVSFLIGVILVVNIALSTPIFSANEEYYRGVDIVGQHQDVSYNERKRPVEVSSRAKEIELSIVNFENYTLNNLSMTIFLNNVRENRSYEWEELGPGERKNFSINYEKNIGNVFPRDSEHFHNNINATRKYEINPDINFSSERRSYYGHGKRKSFYSNFRVSEIAIVDQNEGEFCIDYREEIYNFNLTILNSSELRSKELNVSKHKGKNCYILEFKQELDDYKEGENLLNASIEVEANYDENTYPLAYTGPEIQVSYWNPVVKLIKFMEDQLNKFSFVIEQKVMYSLAKML
jgi:hypothetical protein